MTDSSPKWKNITVSLGDLKPWADNPRMSTKKQAKRLLESWEQFGQVESIAVGPGLEVYDGHQRLSALLTLHGASYEIDARQSNRPLTDDERRRLVIALHAGAVGSWNWDSLANWDTSTLAGGGFDAELLKDWKKNTTALSEFLKSEQPASEDVEPEIDRAEELRQKWGVELGQMWQLGDHRIICGDCTDRAVVERVMGGERATVLFTDPPYGVSIGAKNRLLNSFRKGGRNSTDIESDQDNAEDLGVMLLNAFMLAKTIMADDCAVFVCSPQGGSLGLMMMMMRDAGLEIRHVLNWVKNSPTFSLGRLDYDYQHEPILFTWNKTHKRRKNGAYQTSVWNVDKPRKSADHPTMKPVELPVNALLNHSDEADICYEPFSGSGTTLIACENLKRRCRAIEISPAYVAVAIERWATLTGQTPKLLEE